MAIKLNPRPMGPVKAACNTSIACSQGLVPCGIRGFHSDTGSEFLNRHVAKLLHKLLISEFTKSRAHRTTDNALVEGKNGAVVRKHIGHDSIAAGHRRCGF